MAERLKAMGAPGYENGFKVTLLPHRLSDPSRRKKPTLYFVDSMSDLFHEEIPDDYIDRVFAVMASTPQHTYQVLTKRTERMAAYFRGRSAPTSNVWLGASVEDQRHGVPRIGALRTVPAGVRFLSVEPLLADLGRLDLTGIQWVIVGGESGRGARRMELPWVEAILRQCQEQGVAFFFKQWGAWGSDGVHRSKRKNGRQLLGRTWDAMPPLNNMALTASD